MGMLCSPGVLHAQQWQQHSIEQCLQRLQLQQQNSQMQEQLHKLAAEAQQEKTGSRVSLGRTGNAARASAVSRGLLLLGAADRLVACWHVREFTPVMPVLLMAQHGARCAGGGAAGCCSRGPCG
jgi:hypothetical protein